jgi:uncharacterized DUF497 family protein
MSLPTAFEWDDTKAASNLAKHEVSFDYVIRVFLDDGRLIADTTRGIDGEERGKATGMIDGKLYTAVYTMRGTVCRIISARRSNRSEERSYGYR